MVQILADTPSVRLLKHSIRCYLLLFDNPRACEALKTCLPELLRTFSQCLREDPTTRRWLTQLLIHVGGGGQMHRSQRTGIPGGPLSSMDQILPGQ